MAMEAPQLQQLWAAFANYGGRSGSPYYASLCARVAEERPAAVADLFSRFYRIISAEAPNPPLFLAALHHVRLSQGMTGDWLVHLEEDREAVLDYMLSYDLQPHYVERSAAVLLGVWQAQQRLGGEGVSLVEFGCAGGLNLSFDRYAYRMGGARVGQSPLELTVGGSVPVPVVPRVVGRYGLDRQPRDPRDQENRRLLESFLAPDQTESLAHLRAASDLAADLDLRAGEAESDLFPLLVEAYTQMPAHHTLVVVNTYTWTYLSDPQRQATAHAIQRLAAGLTAYKPMAWVQFEPEGRGAELKLHTFGWADQEDREVVRLAEADPLATQMRWLLS